MWRKDGWTKHVRYAKRTQGVRQDKWTRQGDMLMSPVFKTLQIFWKFLHQTILLMIYSQIIYMNVLFLFFLDKLFLQFCVSYRNLNTHAKTKIMFIGILRNKKAPETNYNSTSSSPAYLHCESHGSLSFIIVFISIYEKIL